MKFIRRIMAKKAISAKKKQKPKKIACTFSSGNLFKDFGFQNPEEAHAKLELALVIRKIIKDRKLTQQQAAKLMNLHQPKVSKIIRGILSEFTIDRLMNCLVALGCDVEIKTQIKKTVVPSIHVSSSLGRLRAAV